MTGKLNTPLRRVSSTTIKNRRNSAETENSQLRMDLQQLKAEFEDYRSRKSDEIKNLNVAINANNKENLTENLNSYYYKGRMMSAGKKIDYMKEDMNQLKQDLETMTVERDSAVLKLEQRDNREDHVTENVDSHYYKGSMVSADRKIEYMQVELDQLRMNLEAVTVERDFFASELQKSEEKMIQQAKRMEEDATTFHTQRNNLENTVAALKKELAEKDRRRLEDKESLEKVWNEKFKSFQRTNAFLEKKVEDDQNYFKKREDIWLSEKESLILEKDNLNGTVGLQRTEILKTSEDLANLELSLKTAQTELAKCEKSKNHLHRVYLGIFAVVFLVFLIFSIL